LQSNLNGCFLHASHDTVYTAPSPNDYDSRFYIKYLYEDVVEIVNSHGKYLAADHSQLYIAHHQHMFDTKWHMEWYSGRVAFRVKNHNRYLGISELDGQARAHHELTLREMFIELP